MLSYAYKGVDRTGSVIEGNIQAESFDDAERKLAGQQISVHALRPSTNARANRQKQETSQPIPAAARKKVSAQDSADVLANLAVMSETGVPFVEALDAVIFGARTPAIKACLQVVKEGVVGGQGLANSLRLAPNMFPQIIVDMVRVAETGGKLDIALRNGANYLQRAAELRRKIVNAMLYPSVMMGVSTITIFILIVFVMPRFALVFTQMKAEIPTMTKMMLLAGNSIRANPTGSAIVFAVIIGLLWKGSSIPIIRTITNKVLDNTPMLGSLLRKLAIARALQSIATLTSSNVPLLTAIEQGAKVAGNRTVELTLLDAKDQIEQGASMSDALKSSNIFPRQIVQMIAIGEKSGRLSQLLETVCGSMETEIDGRLKALVSVIEPVMIVSMGLIVGSITMSIIGPIYSVIENIR